MQEENYLDQLFEAARSEAPKLSYEQVAQQFTVGSTPSGLALFKEWIQQHFFIKTLLMLSIGSTLIVSLWFIFNPVKQEKIVLANMPIQVLEEEQDTNLVEVSKQLVAPVQLLKPMYVSPILPVWQPEEVPYYEAPVLEERSEKRQEIKTVRLPTSPLPSAVKPQASNKIKEDKAELTTLILESTASDQEVASFIAALKKCGVYKSLDLKPGSRQNPIKKLTLQLEVKGKMNWGMNLKGFKKLELKLTLDENQKIETLSYRINDKGEYSDPAWFKHTKDSHVWIEHSYKED